MKRIAGKTKMAWASLFIALVLIPSGWSTGASSSANPSLQALEGRPCAPEPTVMTIAYGDLITCQIDVIGDIDTFRFSGTVGEVVSILVSQQMGQSGTSCVELFDPAGRQIDTQRCTPFGARIDARLARTGTYTIRVSEALNDEPVTYALSLERIAPPSPSARPLSFGQNLNGEINPVGDIDLYLFNGTAGDTVTILVSQQMGQSGTSCVEFFDPEGNQINTQQCTPFGARTDARLVRTGIHTIRVSEALNDETLAYRINLQCVGQCQDTPLMLNLPLVSVGQASEGIRQTAFVVVNTSSSTVRGTLELVQSNGLMPLRVNIGGTTGSQFSLSIPPGGVQILETRDTTPLAQGFARVTSDGPIGAYVIVRSADMMGQVVFETSYGAPTPMRSFTVVANSIGPDVDSGLVILNLSADQRADLALRLINRNGQQVGSPVMLSVGPVQLATGPTGDVIRFMSTDLFAAVPGISEFEGTIAITSSADVAVLAVHRRGNRLTLVPVF